MQSSDSLEEKSSFSLGGSLLLLLITTVISYWWALFLYPLWGWFIYPTFGVSLPSNPWLVAGMVMTVKYILDTSATNTKTKAGDVVTSIIVSFIFPPVTWLIGYAYVTFGGGIH